MNQIDIIKLKRWYGLNFQQNIKGRYLTFEMILPLIQSLKIPFSKEIIGYSYTKRYPLYKISIGNGSTKVLLWSQMHGNESTGTKALFDLFNFLENPGELSVIKEQLLNKCTLIFIPMLNPDGAKLFTRVNAQGVDLNRDVHDLKAPESIALKEVLLDVCPSFCFNLHDQRTIFGVDGTKNPATISFLAPSEDENRTLTEGRKITMSVIVSMNTLLQTMIPNQIGRFTDEFYPTATGDNFQKAGHNTILIEAGHYKKDYEREIVRKYNFFALVQGLHFIASTKDYAHYKSYFDIPNNRKQCFDIIYRNAKYPNNTINDIAIQYAYKIKDNRLMRYKEIMKTGKLTNFFGHLEIDLKGKYIDVETLLNS